MKNFIRKFLFLDRDGTLIRNRHYLSDPDGVEFCPGATKGLSEFIKASFHIVVVTNQSGIGRGYFTLEQMHDVHQRISDLLHTEGIVIAGFLYCPHRPEDACRCRKPSVGLIEDYQKRHAVELGKSWVIGDRWCDIAMAQNAGLGSVWIENTRHQEEIERCRDHATYVVSTIFEAARLIIG